MSLFRLATLGAVCAAAAVAQESRASTGAATYSDRVVAKVNRTVITRSDLLKSLGAAGQRVKGKELEDELDRAAVRAVLQQVEEDAVTQVGLRIPKRFVDEQLERQKEEAYKRGDSFTDVLAEENATEGEFRDELQARIQRETYLSAVSGSFRGNSFRAEYWPEPTAADVRAYYKRFLAEEFTIKNRSRVFAIGLPFSQFPADRGRPVDERARQVAEIIREKLATGADFATLARQYSRSQELKPDAGGDLGWIEAEKSAYSPLIADYAAKGAVKRLSDPIPYPRAESPRSLILLWVNERVERRVIGFDEAQEGIRERLRQARLSVAKGRARAKLLEQAYIWPPQLKQQLLN